MKSKLLLLLLVLAVVASLNADLREVDKSEWIDPNDMVNFDANTKKMRKGGGAAHTEEAKAAVVDSELRRELAECRQSLLAGPTQAKEDGGSESRVSDSTYQKIGTALIKQILRRVLDKLRLANVDGKKQRHLFDAVLELDKSSLVTVQEMLRNSAEPGTDEEMALMHDSAEVLAGLIKRAKSRKDDQDPTWVDLFWKNLPQILQIANLCCIIPALGILCTLIFRENKWRLCLSLIFLAFWLSVAWTWLHLCKSKAAERQARLETLSYVDACKPDEYTVTKWLRDAVKMTPEDKCVQYHKDLLVEPFWAVPPTEALAITITKFFVSPAGMIGRAFAEFSTNFYGNVPILLWPVAALTSGGFILLLLLLFCGYSIRLPFGLLTVGPTANTQVVTPPAAPNPIAQDAPKKKAICGPSTAPKAIAQRSPSNEEKENRIPEAKKKITYPELSFDPAAAKKLSIENFDFSKTALPGPSAEPVRQRLKGKRRKSSASPNVGESDST